MADLLEHIKHIVWLDPKECEIIQGAFTPVFLNRNAFLIKEGHYCNHIAFVREGKLRIYYYDKDGNDVTCFFVAENSFVSSYTSFLSRTPTVENISAIEDTQLLVISRDELERVSDLVPKLHIVRRVIAENLFMTMEKRISLLQSQSADERYQAIIEQTPEIILNVPLQYTASYIGVTPQHLSRLRKNLKR